MAEEFLAVCLGPTVQRTVSLESLETGEVNRGTSVRVDVSGKGVNVSRVLSQMGCPVRHLTHAGGAWRAWFLEECVSEGFLVRAPDSASEIRTCTTLLDTLRSKTTEIVEPTEPVAPGTQDAVLAAFREELPAAHSVVLSGSIPPGYDESVFAVMVEECHREGKRVIADFRGPALIESLQFAPDVIKPNLQEFVATFCDDIRGAVSEHETAVDVLERVRDEMAAISATGTEVIVTRGALPSLHTCRGDIVLTEPAELTPVNTIGCGDAFTAGLAAELHETGDLARAVQRGHECAALNAVLQKPGSIRE